MVARQDLQDLRDFLVRACADALAHREGIDRRSRARADIEARATSWGAALAYRKAADRVDALLRGEADHA